MELGKPDGRNNQQQLILQDTREKGAIQTQFLYGV